MDHQQIKVNDRIKFSHPHGQRRMWWTVRACSERFAVLTAQAMFQPKGTLWYTIIDWEQGIRGACNLIGGGYGDGTYSTEECEQMLAELRIAELEVSHRNNIPIQILETSAAEGADHA